MKYTTIFWDWNGTLLDDRDYNIECINAVCKKHGHTLLDRETYYKTFGFPIIDFYRKIGFDFDVEDYNVVADEYTEAYQKGAGDLPLRKGVKEALAVYADKGHKQIILTASERGSVEKEIKKRGIDRYFEAILGLDNVLACGKTGIGKKYLSEHPLDGKAILIGDTAHDSETAKELGMDCVLLRGGHTSDENLSKLGVPVVDEANQTYRYVLPTGRGSERTVCDLSFVSRYKSFYDDLKNTNKTEDW